MTLQSSGAISLSEIQTEFGGANPISMSEYYRGGSYTTGNNTSVPTSGEISMTDFYGTVAQDPIATTLTATTSQNNRTTYAWNGASIGTADANRLVVLVFAGNRSDNINRYLTSMKINNTSCLKIQHKLNIGSDYCAVGIAALAVPTGTTANFYFSANGGFPKISMWAFSVIGDGVTPSATPVSTATGNGDLALSWTSGGSAIIAVNSSSPPRNFCPSSDFTNSTIGGHGGQTHTAGYTALQYDGTSLTVTQSGSTSLGGAGCAAAFQ